VANVAAVVPAREVFHTIRRPFLVAKWRHYFFFASSVILRLLFWIGLYSLKPIYQPSGLYHITSVRLSTGMLALAPIVQSAILEMVICAHRGIVLRGWDAGLAAMLWCSVEWVEVGSANVALLIFIPSSVMGIFQLLPWLLTGNVGFSTHLILDYLSVYSYPGGPHRKNLIVTLVWLFTALTSPLAWDCTRLLDISTSSGSMELFSFCMFLALISLLAPISSNLSKKKLSLD